MNNLGSGMIAAAWMLTGLMVPAPLCGQTAWYEGFEGPEITWRHLGGNASHRIQGHQRVQGEAHTGDGCERLTVLSNHGSYVYMAHEVGRPRVIEDLLPTVWIKSDRAGLQLLARVVLPRTKDPRTARPVSTLLPGSIYTLVNRWQQLRIDQLPRLLAQQVRILRTQLGPGVDGREAYIDRILLNVYGGRGATNVWIDDLDIAGYVSVPPAANDPLATPGPDRAPGRRAAGGDGAGGDSVGRPADIRPRPRRMELVQSVLLVEGRPFFPRVIRHQGEPLSFLKQLGFNAVWLAGPATAELLAEANRLGLWLICPPPRPSSSYMPQDRVIPLPEIGPDYDPVLAWDLGRGLSKDQLESTRGWAEQVRLADRRQRPLICLAEAELRAYSREVDLLLFDRRPLGTSLELVDYGYWLRRQPRLAVPGTLIWTTVQTEPAASLRLQLAALDPDRQPPQSVPGEQIRLLVYTAIASGSRGLLFESQSPLNARDPQTRQRAMTLELLNLELQLLNPWAAAGSFVANAAGSRREVTGTVLRTERAWLLLPIWSERRAQYVPGQSAANALSLVVPGVPESSRAYELGLGRLQPIRHKRVTGGMRVTLDEFGLTAAVLLAHDPLVISSLTRESMAIGPRAAELQRRLAARKFHSVRQVAEQLNHQAATVPHARCHGCVSRAADWISDARKSFQSCDGHLAAGDYQAAYVEARRAMRWLRLIERAYWEEEIKGLPSPVSSPAAVSYATLPWHARLTRRIASSRPGPNQLSGGDFERLSAMLSAGWNHFEYPSAGLRAKADLLPEAARSGFSGLRLTVEAVDPENPPAIVSAPPVWITSPAVPVEKGQLVCIEGWLRIPKAIGGSVDGLLIIDSLTGNPLAERIKQTAGWQQFMLYRVAPQSGRVTVTFALSGVGEVWLDDVSIRRLEPSDAGRITRLPLPGG